MDKLSDLPNIGKVLEQLLAQIGVSTPEQLRKTGAKEAFVRIKMNDSSACVRMLYGLQGAICGVRDTLLTEETKQDLRSFYKTGSVKLT